MKRSKKTTTKNKFFYFFCKRITDILFAIIGLLFFVIVWLFVKIAYVITEDFKPIIYVHKRVGKNNKIFKMYKFRTMVYNSQEVLEELLKDPKIAEEWYANYKLEKDPRITTIGKILRLTSIDELPQFINILKGDMSLIGPRPLVEDEVEQYKKDKEKLLSVKPGLTGYWACNGRSNCTPKERRELELYYVEHCSILLDIKIFFMTIIKVLTREGAK